MYVLLEIYHHGSGLITVISITMLYITIISRMPQICGLRVLNIQSKLLGAPCLDHKIQTIKADLAECRGPS